MVYGWGIGAERGLFREGLPAPVFLPGRLHNANRRANRKWFTRTPWPGSRLPKPWLLPTPQESPNSNIVAEQ